MKKLLMVSTALLLLIWVVMFFIFKTGDAAYIVLAVAGIIILFLYSMRRVIT
jgi:hypothetical protein